MSGATYYILSYSHYEDYCPTVLWGPRVENFQAYCDSLLPEAVELTLNKKETLEDGSPWITWIGWDTIEEALLEILKMKGYEIVELEEANYWGSGIIKYEDEGKKLTGDLLQRVIEHNERVERE